MSCNEIIFNTPETQKKRGTSGIRQTVGADDPVRFSPVDTECKRYPGVKSGIGLLKP